MPCGRMSIASRRRACGLLGIRDRGFGFAARELEREMLFRTRRSSTASGHWRKLFFDFGERSRLEDATYDFPLFPAGFVQK